MSATVRIPAQLVRALAYERARIVSVSLTWWVIGTSLVSTALAAWACSAITNGVVASGATVSDAETLMFVTGKASTAPLAAGVLGAFAICSDFRHGTLRATLLVTPRRGLAIAAKAIVVSAVAAALAVACAVVAGVVGDSAMTSGLGLGVGVGGLAYLLASNVALTVGWAVFGLALGVLLRSQVLALGMLVLLPFAVERVVRVVGLLTGTAWLQELPAYLPFSAGRAMTSIGDASGALLAPSEVQVSPPVAAMIFFTTIGLLGAAGALRFRWVRVD